MTKAQKFPTPAERPDLYDAFDYQERPKGYKTGVRMPASLTKVAEKRAVAAE
ncbi:hypothetical protein [Parvibaculum sp.]|uniref:hypothetical protein n=1 Tax=Parvibaculum sp. TaxID=2024848 RepID=UPI002732D740|nr:hypothetical protein [Parvibaculum sp.]MDP3327182.1 hypothetical protein [Parvibaculum sp.]